MDSIINYLTSEHRSCDNTFARLEDAFVDKETENTKKYFQEFAESMEKHLQREEEVLFPAFEAAAGSSMGPTQVMKMEHVQIRELIKQISEAIQKDDSKKISGLLETMMILIQQHNMKEEQVLYPMADRMLGAESESLISGMKKI